MLVVELVVLQLLDWMTGCNSYPASQRRNNPGGRGTDKNMKDRIGRYSENLNPVVLRRTGTGSVYLLIFSNTTILSGSHKLIKPGPETLSANFNPLGLAKSPSAPPVSLEQFAGIKGHIFALST